MFSASMPDLKVSHPILAMCFTMPASLVISLATIVVA